ncbi:MAG TPA: hypothetical protein VN687_10365 [Blastocatellia bacterium]|nr:hypothetical protein [Blastocatellia bacterium]
MKTQNRIVVTVLAFVLLLAMATASSKPALAERESTNLDVRTSVFDASYQALKELPVMVSVINDGAVVKQREVHFNSSASFALPAGVYDVRMEGDGMQTLVKRGIHVNEGDITHVVGGPMRAGTGVKTIEFATGALSREEVAARLAKLETAVADLQKTRSK